MSDNIENGISIVPQPEYPLSHAELEREILEFMASWGIGEISDDCQDDVSFCYSSDKSDDAE